MSTYYWNGASGSTCAWDEYDETNEWYVNLYTDAELTTHATALPTTGDSVVVTGSTCPASGPGTISLGSWDSSGLSAALDAGITVSVTITGSLALGSGCWSGNCSAASSVNLGTSRLADGAGVGNGRTIPGFQVVGTGTITFGNNCAITGNVEFAVGGGGGAVIAGGTGTAVGADLCPTGSGAGGVEVDLSDGTVFTADQTLAYGLALHVRLAATQTKQDLKFTMGPGSSLDIKAATTPPMDGTLHCNGLIIDAGQSGSGGLVSWEDYSIVDTSRGFRLVAGDATWSYDPAPAVRLLHEGFDADLFGLAARSVPDHAEEADVRNGIAYDHGAKEGTLAAGRGGMFVI